MKVKVNGYELELNYTMGTTYIYEKIHDEPFDITQLGRQSVLMDYFYCNILQALKANKYPIDFSMEDFFAWVDENGGILLLNDYANWLAKQIELQYKLSPQIEDNETKKKVRQKK